MRRLSWREPQKILERADAVRAKRELALRVSNWPTVQACERELEALREELGRVMTRPLWPELEAPGLARSRSKTGEARPQDQRKD